MEKTGNVKKLEKANNVLSKELDEIRESNSILNKENSDPNEKLKVKSSLVKSLQEELWCGRCGRCRKRSRNS